MAKEVSETKKTKCECGSKCCSSTNSNGAAAGGGAVYGFGLLGALFFYLSAANSFGTVVMGILKSLVWPGMMVYHLFNFLGI